MNTIYKVAVLFQKKLVLAANTALEQISTARKAASELHLTKQLWENAAEYEPMVSVPLDKINSLSLQWVSNAKTYGLTGSQNADYMLKLNNEIKELESAKMVTPLDPMASNKLGALKNALDVMVPVSVPAQVTKPTPKTNKPEPSGAAYNAEEEGGQSYDVEPGAFSPGIGPLAD